MLLFFSISSQCNRSRALAALQIRAFELVTRARAPFRLHAKVLSSFVSYCCALFCILNFANSFSFNSFRTLCGKYRGVGGYAFAGFSLSLPFRPDQWAVSLDPHEPNYVLT